MTDPIQSGAPASAPNALSDVERKKVAELARQFESMLMTQMLREMRKSMLTEEEAGSGYGAAAMTDTIDVELGSALSRTGGFGLADVLTKAFDRQAAGRKPAGAAGLLAPVSSGQIATPSPLSPVSAVAAPARATAAPAAISSVPAMVPSAGSTAATGAVPTPASRADKTGESSAPSAVPVLPEGRVSSGYGWRTDPFNGQVRFHSGTDVKMAYGGDVQSAAAGRVTFVGEQSGYGLVVKIDHGNGVETRYGHLSHATVHVGETVGSGQRVARSGNSGRSTGPHLHFEVLENGRAVAPETMGQLLH
jgi:murein DD-endopeptidase MepM/ murein hydrolase activator NlpD